MQRCLQHLLVNAHACHFLYSCLPSANIAQWKAPSQHAKACWAGACTQQRSGGRRPLKKPINLRSQGGRSRLHLCLPCVVSLCVQVHCPDPPAVPGEEQGHPQVPGRRVPQRARPAGQGRMSSSSSGGGSSSSSSTCGGRLCFCSSRRSRGSCHV